MEKINVWANLHMLRIKFPTRISGGIDPYFIAKKQVAQD